jgi:NAD(P)-dependent dehydrogenase (short-subunit alcohol dehydrogenase family)
LNHPPACKVAWITGASTGIGAALARHLASRGVAVAASARSVAKLVALGPGIHAYPVDVTDGEAMAAVARQIAADLGPIDLAVFGAGAYQPLTAEQVTPEAVRAVFDTNVMGVVHGLSAVLGSMRRRRQGQIAWIASVAGYRGLPKAAAYGASKAALINMAESLRPELARDGVFVSVINPGFVETPMTAQNDFPMPFLMTPDAAAERIVAGLAKRKFEIAFPRRFVTLLKLARLLPYGIYFRLIDRFVLPRS